jgi:plasmid stability protein
MGDVRIRDLDPAVVLELKAQARRKGRTLQSELKELLTEAALKPRRELVAELRAFQKRLRDKYGELPDSTPGIRAWRDGLE